MSMDVIDGLPRSKIKNDRIWMIVDSLTKRAYFISVRPIRTTTNLPKLYMKMS